MLNGGGKMQNRILSALVTAAAGVLLMLIPQFILPVCELSIDKQTAMELGNHLSASHEDISAPALGQHAPAHMACFYTAQAEAGLGAALILAGLLLLVLKSDERRLGVSLSLTLVAALAGAVPWFVIGVCASEQMLCRSGTLPALLIVSAAILLYSGLNAWYLHHHSKRRGHV
jgi:hypothetical protein